jgi:glutaconyl-CoA/methylmalonyl-CoA decarboxylase subunit gamma
MKLQVCVGDETFQVEIDDLHARPIVARVDGEEFAVWPDSGPVNPANGTAVANGTEAVSAPHPPLPRVTSAEPAGGSAVHAPIPGVIQKILVKEGDRVEAGQEICMLEAMKMQNTIRAPHAGRISRVAVVVGQAVKHRDVLLEFGD